MLHVIKLLVERQRLMSKVKLGMCNYCFISVSDYMLVFVMVFVSRFGRYNLKNVVAGYRWILYRGYGFTMGLLLLSNFGAFCEWFCWTASYIGQWTWLSCRYSV